MNKSLEDRVTHLRFLSQNPYALIEYLEDFDEAVSVSVKVADASRSQLSESRKVMQDPYAYLDGNGGFSAEANISEVALSREGKSPEKPQRTSADNQKRRHSDAAIEAKAIALQRRLWLERDRLWEGAAPTNPLDVLDIRKALHLAGYELIFESGLGHDPRTQIEVAGLIDRDAKVVRCSHQFLEPYRSFTLAHELGHAVLHPDAGGIHRDRPLDGAKRSRAPGEWEADRFAAFFLMPEKLLRECFFQRFGTECFVVTDDTAFALSRTTSDVVLQNNPTIRHLARLLATTETYNSRPFKSLAAQFRVSVGAMAFRLEELGLVRR
ncbi:MAG: ImmA/IrrE family metallo-endopeptidase [Luteibacter sp.]|uniref:ImmA/IrrE family metallo-endopeptidase n=1 Tax=Luteibacter sp. TaxID=1886636 RepID=UPI0028084404|nr:ImmA/IrrE family metallo-endopeptidase [Luteibacter sp.]MDQ7996906.1 ImmA/IrrE family metallo-endopeptidase [Luteibacter sp.]MDQ8049277.1 ImmA/IrrE family metallo-endopeptidase [Luteibacter sp.]